MNKINDINKQIKRISLAEKNGSYEKIKKYLLKKRLTWLENNKKILNKIKGDDLKKHTKSYSLNI